MQRFWRLMLTASTAVLVYFAVPAKLGAQGVATGSVRGRVTTAEGLPVVGAELRWSMLKPGSRTRRRPARVAFYNIENVTPGGPFTLTARAIGYRPTSQSGIRVSLSQVVTMDLKLEQSAVTLAELTVNAAARPALLLSRARTGASVTISDSFLLRLPTLSRNFTGPDEHVAQVNSASVAGQNNRYNNIQIDGGVNNDLFPSRIHRNPRRSGERATDFARGAQGIPGPHRPVRCPRRLHRRPHQRDHQVRNEPVPRVALRIPGRPGFRPEVRGPRAVGHRRLNNFHEYQYGGSLGGPIIRDKLQFFATSWNSRAARRRSLAICRELIRSTGRRSVSPRRRPTVSPPGPTPISAIPDRPGR